MGLAKPEEVHQGRFHFRKPNHRHREGEDFDERENPGNISGEAMYEADLKRAWDDSRNRRFRISIPFLGIISVTLWPRVLLRPDP